MVRKVRFDEKDKKKEIVAIGYTRVSTIEQAREGISLDAQKEMIRNYCKTKGYKLKHIYEDVESAYRYRGQKRKDFRNAMKDIQQGGCDVFVCHSLTRFYRRALETLEAVKTIKEKNVGVVFIADGIDTTTGNEYTQMMGQFMISILSAVAEQESAQTSIRVKTVLRHKAKNGEYCGSKAPLGYKLTKEIVKTLQGKELKVVPPYYEKLPEDHPNRKKVEEIFRLYSRGEAMDKIGVKVGKNPSTVCNIISNPTYTGLMVFEPGSNAKINEGDWEAYISISTFNANQRRRAKNNFNPKAKNHRFTIHKEKGKYICKPIAH